MKVKRLWFGGCKFNPGCCWQLIFAFRNISTAQSSHINFVGQFDLDLKRKPPFNIRLAA
jgi:hypothetical protein